MGSEHGAQWRASDSAGSALVLVVAAVWWAVVGVATGLCSLALQLTRSERLTEPGDEL